MTMTVPGACTRLFEAEAMRDGRLAGAQLASFVRHTATCAACRHEVHALDALAKALRASAADGAHADELGRLRDRTRLVAAFDATLVATRRRTAARRPALWAAAAALVVVGAVLLSRPRLTGDEGSASAVVVHAAPGAVWSKQTQVDHERVVLDSGELWIHVDHARQRTRLVVALPDGELEDTGTTFTVNATNGRTTRVAVSEGSVVLRIKDKPPLTLGGGETWAVPVASPRAPAPEDSPPVSPPSDRTSHRPVRKPAAPAARVALRSSPSVPAESAVADAGLDFRAAVDVLDVGANRQAAAAFARFLAMHPHDARAEDAAYLQVLALQRCGATDEARRAAQAYLRQFPAGFRRVEIETLSR